MSVRYGSRHEEPYPQCGCDACDGHEQPDELVQDLQRKIDAVVAGRFSESVVSNGVGTWLKYEFRFRGDGRASGGTRFRDGDPLQNQGEVVWPPWPVRRSANAWVTLSGTWLAQQHDAAGVR